jgi:hypothetical protein
LSDFHEPLGTISRADVEGDEYPSLRSLRSFAANHSDSSPPILAFLSFHPIDKRNQLYNMGPDQSPAPASKEIQPGLFEPIE